MTAWVPLFKNRIPASHEFNRLAKTIVKSDFQRLSLAKPDTATDLPDTAGSFLQSPPHEMPNQTEKANRRIAEMEEREAQLTAEVGRLQAEMDLMAKAHETETKAMAETLLASLLRQHFSSMEDLKTSLAASTAKVLRPILSSAAADAAVRDFKRISSELVASADGAAFSIKTSDHFLQRLGKMLPQQIKIIPCDCDASELSINIGKEVITSRLVEWSQLIAGSDLDE